MVYRADQDINEVFELYSVPVAGGTPAKLSGALVTNGDVSSDFAISPDSSRVIYKADQDVDNKVELYSVPIGGGSPVKLNMPIVDGAVPTYDIAPDSSRVVFTAYVNWSDGVGLYSVPLAGGSPVEISAIPGFSADVISSSFAISRNSARVVYLSAYDNDPVHTPTEIYSTSIINGVPIKLNTQLVDGGYVRKFAVSPDSTRVAYVADQETVGVNELYGAPILVGGNAVKLSQTLINSQRVYSGMFSPDSNRVLYDVDQGIEGTSEVFALQRASRRRERRLAQRRPERRVRCGPVRHHAGFATGRLYRRPH